MLVSVSDSLHLGILGDTKEICDGQTAACATQLWVRESISGGIGTDAVNRILLLIPNISSPFFRCFEEAGYDRYIGDILGHILETLLRECPRDSADLIRFVLP